MTQADPLSLTFPAHIVKRRILYIQDAAFFPLREPGLKSDICRDVGRPGRPLHPAGCREKLYHSI